MHGCDVRAATAKRKEYKTEAAIKVLSAMGCCSSKNAEEPEDGSPRYSEIGAHCLQSANAHIQVRYH